MSDKSDPSAKFRAQATLYYRIMCVGLVSLIIGAGWLGWHLGGWIGLGIGTVVGVIVAVIGWFGVTLIWAMTQDGA